MTDFHLSEAEGSAILTAAVRYVKEESQGKDGSHDFWHIARVMRLATTLAKEEGIAAENIEVVQLGAGDPGHFSFAMLAIRALRLPRSLPPVEPRRPLLLFILVCLAQYLYQFNIYIVFIRFAARLRAPR